MKPNIPKSFACISEYEYVDTSLSVSKQQQSLPLEGVVVVVHLQRHCTKSSDLTVGLIRAQLVELDLTVTLNDNNYFI